MAYEAYEQKHGPGKRLPGLEQFDSKKLFFIAFGQVTGVFVILIMSSGQISSLLSLVHTCN